MSEKTKDMILESLNTVCYAAVVVACCTVITFSWVMISASSVIQAI